MSERLKDHDLPPASANKKAPINSSNQGSGLDKNSDTSRLKSREDLLDKTVEDSFPASDPPSKTPITGH